MAFHLFCIHHTDNSRRKKRLLRRFAELGLEAEWVETYHPRERPRWDHDGLSGGSVGETSCALKHRDAMRRQVERSIPMVLVLEDDVDLPDSFARDLGTWLEEFKELRGDILMIGACFDMHPETIEPGRSVYYSPDFLTRCTHAYVLPLETACRILPDLDHMPKGIGHDLNDAIRRHGLRVCYVEPGIPQLTHTGEMLSSIGTRRTFRDRIRVTKTWLGSALGRN
jgi:GR25 family glycosyltransferase involved in LPS biosynthesis